MPIKTQARRAPSLPLARIARSFGLGGVQLAGRLQITQNRVPRIEHGDIERTQVDSFRKFVEAIGGTLSVEVELGDERIQIS